MSHTDPFIYPERPYALLFSRIGIADLSSAMDWVRALPYGRTSQKGDLTLVIKERVGSCSSKHACLYSLITEQEILGWDLILGIYRMNESNTPRLKGLLSVYNLSFLPEAHTYLRHNGITYDLTFPNSSFDSLKNDIIIEETILPHQVINYKVSRHKDFIQNWIKDEKINLTFDEAWYIREQCIHRLSTK